MKKGLVRMKSSKSKLKSIFDSKSFTVKEAEWGGMHIGWEWKTNFQTKVTVDWVSAARVETVKGEINRSGEFIGMAFLSYCPTMIVILSVY